MRILYIHATPVPPTKNPCTDRFFLLSQTLEGDVLQPVWFHSGEQVEAELGPGSYPVYTSGKFRYHWFLTDSEAGRRRTRVAQFWFLLRKALELNRQNRFDCILAYSHMTNGLLGSVVKLLTGGKLIIEVATTPRLITVTHRPRLRFSDRLRKLYSDLSLHLTVGFADRVHLLYPKQLEGYPLLRKVKASVFHEFIPTSTIPAHADAGEERYVVMVGSPWYLKGVDRLIAAFKRLAPDFPEVKLKLIGWYLEKEREELEALSGGCTQIEMIRAMPNPLTLPIISRAMVLVHPSRCEGGPSRVVTEALAAGVPVIGSDVAGIPYAVRNGENGYIFPGEDIGELEKLLRELLSDAALRRRLGENGYRFAHTQLTEQVYVDRFTDMVRAAVQGGA